MGAPVRSRAELLVRILDRTREHHHKKTPMLRRLKVSEGRFHAPVP